MAVTSVQLESAYHDGVRDGRANHYDPPVGFWKRATGFVDGDDLQLKEAYDRGYEGGRSGRA